MLTSGVIRETTKNVTLQYYFSSGTLKILISEVPRLWRKCIHMRGGGSGDTTHITFKGINLKILRFKMSIPFGPVILLPCPRGTVN